MNTCPEAPPEGSGEELPERQYDGEYQCRLLRILGSIRTVNHDAGVRQGLPVTFFACRWRMCLSGGHITRTIDPRTYQPRGEDFPWNTPDQCNTCESATRCTVKGIFIQPPPRWLVAAKVPASIGAEQIRSPGRSLKRFWTHGIVNSHPGSHATSRRIHV